MWHSHKLSQTWSSVYVKWGSNLDVHADYFFFSHVRIYEYQDNYTGFRRFMLVFQDIVLQYSQHTNIWGFEIVNFWWCLLYITKVSLLILQYSYTSFMHDCVFLSGLNKRKSKQKWWLVHLEHTQRNNSLKKRQVLVTIAWQVTIIHILSFFLCPPSSDFSTPRLCTSKSILDP